VLPPHPCWAGGPSLGARQSKRIRPPQDPVSTMTRMGSIGNVVQFPDALAGRSAASFRVDLLIIIGYKT